MDYRQSHLKSWLSHRKLLKIELLEELAGIPKDTLRHFLKERRELPEIHYQSITACLHDYGFVELNAE